MKFNKKVFLIFLVALVIRIIFFFSSLVKWWDETVYANLGYDLSKNLLHYSLRDSLWSDFIPSAGNVIYSWPKIGFRAPLLPYSISILYLLKVDFLIDFLMPFVGALSVVLIYLIGKKLFSERVGIYSAILMCFIPLHVIYSAKILTDVFFTFFILLAILFFWKGFEEKNNKYKLFFGIFLGLSILARYNGLWFIPIFGLYLLIRYRLNLFKDKYFWFSFLLFILVLIPLFIYSFFEYGTILGSFIHGSIASSYWGGLQDWKFFFDNWIIMFSFEGIVFLIALGYILYKRDYVKKEIYFLILFFVLFIFLASIMAHKEDRLLMPIIIVICLISGFFLNELKKYKISVLILIVFLCSISLCVSFSITYFNSYNSENSCFLKANKFLNQVNPDSVIITDESSIVYYYAKKTTHFYTNPWTVSSFLNLVRTNYLDSEVYVLFSPNARYSNVNSSILENDLNSVGEIVFNCENNSRIYHILK